MVKKLLHALFAITLLGFAYLQLNDPDPVVWTGFYLLCALVPLLALCNRHNRYVSWAAIGLCLVVAGIYAPGAYTYYLHSSEEALMQSMNPNKPYIEEAREFLGSLITLVLVVISHLLGKRN